MMETTTAASKAKTTKHAASSYFTVEAVAIYDLGIPPTVLARADEVIE
jgi:hypothetical protein